MANGLASPLKKETETDILSSTRKTFGKLNSKPPTLEKRLESLSEQELNLVLQTANFVKMAHSFGDRSKQSYSDVTKAMYPRLSYNLQTIVADVLQDADPVEAKPIDKSIERDSLINKTLDDYAAALGKATNDIDFSTRVSSDEKKVEQLQSAILQSLEIKQEATQE